jgi:glycosyltransferase involved in cell wall biosynthesis
LKKYAISVLIPVLNESENLAQLLPLLAWAGEIIVVDSYSEDTTVAIAEAAGAKIISRIYTTPAEQKNWAIPQAQFDWVLIFDADERPTPELIAEIQLFLDKNKSEAAAFDGFWIGRENYFLHQRVKYSGWRGDAVIRLIRRDTCRYDSKKVHEEIEQKGMRIGRLEAKMQHFTYRSLDHFIDKLQRYATWAAEDYATKTKKVGLWQLWCKPAFRFFKHYFLQAGFLDGRAGFIISSLMAWGVFLRYAKLLESRNKKINP